MLSLTQEQLSTALKTYLGDFLPYQRKYIADESRFVCVEKAVRIGVTYAHSFKSAVKRAFRDPSAKRNNEYFTSKSLKTAAEYFAYHRKWAEAFNTLNGSKFIPVEKWTTERAIYPGGDINIVSSDPDATRGVEGDQTADELAFSDQQGRLLAAMQSRIQWLKDGQVTLISSHSHPETEFARVADEARSGRNVYSLHSTTLPDAVAQGLARKVWEHRLKDFKNLDLLDKAFIAEIRSSCLSDEDYAREYLCRPAALAELIFPEVYDALAIEPVADYLDPQKPITFGPKDEPCELFAGIDCGRAKDSTVLWVIARYPDPVVGYWIYRTVCVLTLEKMIFPRQHERIEPILSHPQMSKVFIDQGAQGRALADSLAETFGYIVQPIGMGSKNKGEMAELLRAFAQSERITFPADDPKTKQSVCAVRRIPTLGGNLKYDGTTSFDHCDRFWASALAIYAAEGERRATLMLPDQSLATTAPAA